MPFWKFTNKAATETDPESIELRIEGDIIDDDSAWFYELMGVTAASPNAFKAELANHTGKNITVWIDSYGGDVFAAAGIYNALKEHKGKVTVKVDSKAMSAASVIAMAGNEIFMSPVSVMMIHNPSLSGYVEAADMHQFRQYADYLDTVKESIVNAYQLKSKKSRAKISELMDSETFMSAREAMKNGFADAMLYTESQSETTENTFGVSFGLKSCRLAVANSAKETLKHMQAYKSPNDTALLKARLALQLEL